MQKKTDKLSVKIWALLACAAREWSLYINRALAKAFGMQGRKKTYKLAVKIWGLLACAARGRRSYTYNGLAKAFGMTASTDPLNMRKFLEPIMHYCNQNDLPPLTVLVVSQETGLPGEGLKVEGRYKNKDMNWHRERVFEEDWLIIKQPKESDLQKAAETAKP